jgi:hypothetical protein
MNTDGHLAGTEPMQRHVNFLWPTGFIHPKQRQWEKPAAPGQLVLQDVKLSVQPVVAIVMPGKSEERRLRSPA